MTVIAKKPVCTCTPDKVKTAPKPKRTRFKPLETGKQPQDVNGLNLMPNSKPSAAEINKLKKLMRDLRDVEKRFYKSIPPRFRPFLTPDKGRVPMSPLPERNAPKTLPKEKWTQIGIAPLTKDDWKFKLGLQTVPQDGRSPRMRPQPYDDYKFMPLVPAFRGLIKPAIVDGVTYITKLFTDGASTCFNALKSFSW